MTHRLIQLKTAVLAVCFAFIVAVCMAALPTGKAYAADEYPIFVGGVQVTSANAGNVLGDGTVQFISSGSSEVPNKLVLNGARITPLTFVHGSVQYNSCGIFLGHDANTTIEFKGENAIGYVDGSNTYAANFGIFSVDFFSLKQAPGSNGILNILAKAEGLYGTGAGIVTNQNFQLASGIVRIKGAPGGTSRGVIVGAGKSVPSQIDGALDIDVSRECVWRSENSVQASMNLNDGGSLKVHSTTDSAAVDNVDIVVRGGAFEGRVDGDGWVFATYASTNPLDLQLGAKALGSFFSQGYGPEYYDSNDADVYRWVKAGYAAVADIWIGNTPVTGLNADDVLNNGRVRYEFNYQGQSLGVGTLYLNDADLTNVNNASDPYEAVSVGAHRWTMNGDDYCTALYVGADTNIVLSGSSAVEITGYNLEHLSGLYIAPGVSVTIDSANDGFLYTAAQMGYTFFDGSSYGILCEGNLAMKGSAVIAAEGMDGFINAFGVYCEGSLIISESASLYGDADLTATAVSASAYPLYSTGVEAHGSIYVTDNGTLVGCSDDGSSGSYGIYYYGDGTVVFDGAYVEGTAASDLHSTPSKGAAGISVWSDSAGYNSLVITKGTVKATATAYASGEAFVYEPFFSDVYAPSIKWGSSESTAVEASKTSVPMGWNKSNYVLITDVAHATLFLEGTGGNPNLWLVTYTGQVPSNMLPSYNGKVLYRDPIARAWCTLLAMIPGDVPLINTGDFGQVSASAATKVVLAKPNVKGTSEYGYSDMEGDINGNKLVNIVDAQIAYDFATGGLAPTLSLYEKSLLMADVNSDGVLDAADAFSLQRAAMNGGYSKG